MSISCAAGYGVGYAMVDNNAILYTRVAEPFYPFDTGWQQSLTAHVGSGADGQSAYSSVTVTPLGITMNSFINMNGVVSSSECSSLWPQN